MLSLVVLSGNPRTPSKTTAVAARLGALIADALDPAPSVDLIDLAEFVSSVLDPSDAEIIRARDRVAHSQIVIVASPVYKGSYTGLLKAFLDGYDRTSLSGVAAIPLVVAASPAHTTVAAEIHLRPLLHEIGAETPFGALALLEADIVDPRRDALLETWIASRIDLITAAAGRSCEEVAA